MPGDAQSAHWQVPTVSGPVDATVRVPSSKSMTNRAMLLAASSTAPCVVDDPLVSRDTSLMADALRALGAHVTVREHAGEHSVEIDGGGDAEAGAVSINVGNAGTVARFVPPLAAHRPGVFRFDGDERIRARPLGPLLAALGELGAAIDIAPGGWPFTVTGQRVMRGGPVEVDASRSSQFLSALLLAGPGYQRGVTVRALGAMPSAHHVAMTVSMLRAFGATVERDGQVYTVSPGELRRDRVRIEPDLSSAAPLLAVALVSGGQVRVAGWPRESDQPGDQLRSLLTELGGRCAWSDDGLVVTGTGEVRAADLDLRDVGELTPVLAALLCFADGPSVLRGVAHLTGHESDRLAALATELSGLGADVRQTEDGLRINPAPMHGGEFRSYHDHRMVMAGAVIGARVKGVLVENPATVGKTFPDFVPTWDRLVAGS